MNQNPVIVFVCEHGAAKSILAAACFNKLASESDLGMTAIARGTHPDVELSSKTVSGLREEGLTPTESIPVRLTCEEMESAQRVVSFCTLPEEYGHKVVVEYWHDVPPFSEDYERSRDVIIEHLKELIKTL
jgi:arsenate reductase